MDADWGSGVDSDVCPVTPAKRHAASSACLAKASDCEPSEALTPKPISTPDCDEVYWRRHETTLKEQTFEPKLQRPWIYVSGDGFGCYACGACGLQDPWGLGTVHATNCQLHWKRHGSCRRHVEAVTRTQQAEADSRLDQTGSVAPALEDFMKVLQETIANGATDICGIKGIGARKKVRKIQCCLAEAKRNSYRQFWAKCACMTLSQDKRGTRLLARWRACTPDLEVRAGIIGLVRDLPNPFEGKIGADSTRIATVKMLARATSTRPAPYTGAETGAADGEIDAKPDIDEFTNLCSITEVFVADAAADEQRVGKDLGFFEGEVQNVDAEYYGAEGRHDMQAVLPNLKYVGRDRAHALRRALRPWDCDDFFADCKAKFIDGRNAITKAAQFSPVLKKWFVEANMRSDMRTRISNKVADFAWAKQRCDGITQPLGRFVIYIESLIAVANLTISIRPKDAAAIEFLSSLDNESYLQMAMMADATDELSRSVHAFDGAMLDEVEILLEVQNFQARLEALFVSGHCFEIPGYTSFAVNMLKEVRLSIVGKTVKEFGGLAAVPPELAQRCLQRMAAWAELSKVIVQSEFPAFELCSCFAVFVLKARANPQGLTESWRRRALEKLAMAFKLPTSNSIAEFFDMYPIAQNIYCTEGVSNAAAWSSAVRRCFGRQPERVRSRGFAPRPSHAMHAGTAVRVHQVTRAAHFRTLNTRYDFPAS
ncbi:unnamed protein product [Prorocentrum cordatum]|uniref:Uncharacterized protein n=1 Tax=Prorocentrum cordatum TaxID=2364126 RepID=A0ABN9WEM0_9DINO|nr:unnamed protein product [Polarella glacialis]